LEDKEEQRRCPFELKTTKWCIKKKDHVGGRSSTRRKKKKKNPRETGPKRDGKEPWREDEEGNDRGWERSSVHLRDKDKERGF